MVLFFLYLKPPRCFFITSLFFQTCVSDHSHRSLLSRPLTLLEHLCSLGSEGLNIRPSRVALTSAVFTCLLVCVLYSDNCRGYVSFKGSSELTPCVLMIAWVSTWRTSKLCIRSCRNRNWRLPLRVLRHHMWNSPNMLTICCVRWHNPLHILVIVRGSGQMRIWPRISSRSRPTLIWSSWNRMHTTSLVNLLVGCSMRWTLTNRHIHLWTKLEQNNGWICTRSSTFQPLKKVVFEMIKESLADFHLASYLIDEVQIGSVDRKCDIFTTFPVHENVRTLLSRPLTLLAHLCFL